MNGGTVATSTLVRRFHERVDFERLVGAHWCLAGLEELGDLYNQRLVPAKTANCRDSLRAKGRASVSTRVTVVVFPSPAKGSDAAVLPETNSDIRIGGMNSAYGFATWSHNCEKRLDTVNPVPEEIGMCWLDGTGAESIARCDIANRPCRDRFGSVGIAQRRRRKHGSLEVLRNVVQQHGVC